MSDNWTEEQFAEYQRKMGRAMPPAGRASHAGIHPKGEADGNSAGGIQCVQKARRRPALERMTKTERAYAERLTAMGLDWTYEGMSFKLDDGTSYRPDFLVFGKDGLELHEVKGGHIWEDSLIKFKWARQRFSMLRWLMMQKTKDGWREIE